MKKKNICIIHYNTPKLTECLIKSINKFTPDYNIYIFDNSDKQPFTYKQDNITYYDNTKGEIINFEEWLKKYPNRNQCDAYKNGYASAKHCYSVERCMELIDDNFILLDSDVLLKQDITPLWDENCIFVGTIEKQNNKIIDKLDPFACFINVKMCKEKKVHYFNEDYMFGLHKLDRNKMCDYYDTGASFLLFAKQYNNKIVNIYNYIEHFGHGSWQNTSADEWLNQHRALYDKDNKTIVSLTTYKPRMKTIHKVIETLLNQSYKPYKIVLTLYKDDILYVTKELQALIDTNKIEVIITEEDIKPHKKYFYAMQKYPDCNIITVDDDVLYDKDVVDSLYQTHLKYPNCIVGRRVHKILYDNDGNPLQYRRWQHECKTETKPSFDLFFTGVGGVFYPSNIFCQFKPNMDEILKIITADDIYLMYLAHKNNIKVVWAPNNRVMPTQILDNEIQKCGLCYQNTEGSNPKNDEYLKMFKLNKRG